ncbi:hypothetical protein DY000_02042048 [Brassica cretica]|uniref:Uncharacterized protein n=1 Tax=Brassica cretica TaxID=69181 RepID=A0ABQ7BEV1_BRACR|nr:hypothetical protein DY000_02042048 [Brassica cretica]
MKNFSVLSTLIPFGYLTNFFAAPFGSSPMNSDMHGLIEVLRLGRPRWLTFNRVRIKGAYVMPPGQAHAPTIQLEAPADSSPAERKPIRIRAREETPKDSGSPSKEKIVRKAPRI